MPSSRLGRSLSALVCSAALVVSPGLVPPAAAGPVAPADAPYRYESGRPASNGFGAAGLNPGTRPGAGHFDVDEVTTPVAPGLTHTRFDRLSSSGWIRVNLLSADLGTPGLRLNYAGGPAVSSTEPLASMLRRSGAVAGVNGDFFDIGDTGAPLGVGKQRGRGLLHAPASGWNNAFLQSGQQARIASTFLEATVRRAGGTQLKVTNLNSPTIARDGIGIYTPAWGADARSRVVPGQRARQVVVRNGRVRSNSLKLGTGAVPQGATVLVGVGRGARQLSGWRRGNRVEIRYGLDTSAQVAIGGNTVILRNGRVLGGDPVRHPRTAIGVDATGRRVLVLTVDGRASHSTGVTLGEAARILKQWGAVDALNLDGGGSSTMMARHAGASIATMNHTSDGRQRSVPNGLAFRMVSGSTALAGFHVRTQGEHSDDDRVLRGLSRTVVARGYTGRMGPSSARPVWRAGSGASVRNGRSLRAAVVGRAAGAVSVVARNGAARGTIALRVLGPVHRLEPSVGRIVLAGSGSGQYVELRGYDAQGNGTWVEPRDVSLSYNSRLVSVTPSGRGFLVRAKRTDARGPIRFTAGGVTTRVGITVGDKHVRAHSLDGPQGWSTVATRARATLRPTPDRGRRAGGALQVAYRAAKGTRRARHLSLRHAPIRLRPRSHQVRLWIRGDGSGARVRLGLRPSSGNGRWLTIAPRVTWRGWRQVRATIPAALRRAGATPASVIRIRVVPTAKKAHTGRLAFDDLASAVPWKAAALPTLPRDPVVQDVVPARADGARIAVLGDVRLRASAPSSPAVQRFRSALQAARRAGVDQVVLTGDVVDRGTAADLSFARGVLDAELGPVPWVWAPGDGELSGDLTNYRRVLGAPLRVLDRAGVRIITLNSAQGSVRAGGFGQLVRLRQALTRAVAEPGVEAVVVAMHHPARSLVPGAGRRLSDTREAELIEDIIGNAAGQGTPVVTVTGHGRRFQATRYDGALAVSTGPVAGTPAGPAAGAFQGWTLLELAGGRPRMTFVPLPDGVTLSAPAEIQRGSTAATRTGVRQGSRTVRLRYPMAAAWRSSTRVFVGPAARAPWTAYVAVDPSTGTLTGLRRGTTDVTVEVGGGTATARVRVR